MKQGSITSEPYEHRPLFGFVFFLFCKFFFKFYCPLHVKGRENLPTQPFILCSNHASHMDTPVLMLATQLPFSLFGIMAAQDYFFDNSVRRGIVRSLMNIIPISRTSSKYSLAQNIETCKQFIMKKNGCLIIYPEGTRSCDGEIHSFKRGVAILAKELNLPIVPVYIQGTYQSLGKWHVFPKPKKIHLTIGKPVDLITLGAQDNVRVLANQLEQIIKNLKCAYENND